MRIYGLNKTTLLDYPEHVAATLFTGGCNFRCPFCQNGGLVLSPESQPALSLEEVLAFLEKRRGILDGVCITGGEPTLQPDLAEFIRKIKGLGYRVKLDSNGYRPWALEGLLREGLLDYIAMDVKASRENYAKAVGFSNPEMSLVERSIELIRGSGIDYEFRTTVVKGIHSIEEFEELGKWLAGSRVYFLQTYRENENVIGSDCGPFSREEMEEMAKLAHKYIDRVEIRG
ncbi:MAG: anaerobic ribonucleoside-triphosphate reductase activating protein [Roseburia sp.]|nr:anaerobic ribonucleoside-triphosphate reductase activating protein [Roseburia sp.]